MIKTFENVFKGTDPKGVAYEMRSYYRIIEITMLLKAIFNESNTISS
jgi:hypothetical protein